MGDRAVRVRRAPTAARTTASRRSRCGKSRRNTCATIRRRPRATGWTGRFWRGSARASATTGPTPIRPARTRRRSTRRGAAGTPDLWKAADAIFGAANYLKASGAPGDYRKAIYAYNHAEWYVAEVESWAARYRGPPTPPVSSTGGGEGSGAEGGGLVGADTRLASETATPVRFIAGEQAVLAGRSSIGGDGHVAMIPAGVPATVQVMVVAGNELQELPYGPGGHPDPLGATEEDCSSTVNYVLYRSGVRPLSEILTENPLAQDYVDWGDPGPGRWVTIYATDEPTPHVF